MRMNEAAVVLASFSSPSTKDRDTLLYSHCRKSLMVVVGLFGAANTSKENAFPKYLAGSGASFSIAFCAQCHPESGLLILAVIACVVKYNCRMYMLR